MTKLAWDQVGERRYETGVDHGVLYLPNNVGVYDQGYAWNGLTTVTQSPGGAESNPQYADNIKYLNLKSAEEFNGTIEAFTYPDEFAQCDGSVRVRPGLYLNEQRRKPFGFSYRVRVGNDVDGPEHAYKIHLVYNAMVAPPDRSYATMGSESEASNFSWNVTTKPLLHEGYRQSAHVVIDSREIHPTTMGMVEEVLYGTESLDPQLPSLSELIEIFDIPIELTVTDLGDGLFRIEGPDDMFENVDSDIVRITGDTVIEIDPNTYEISSE